VIEIEVNEGNAAGVEVVDDRAQVEINGDPSGFGQRAVGVVDLIDDAADVFDREAAKALEG